MIRDIKKYIHNFYYKRVKRKNTNANETLEEIHNVILYKNLQHFNIIYGILLSVNLIYLIIFFFYIYFIHISLFVVLCA